MLNKQIDYGKYIQSENWKKKRLSVLENPYWGRPNKCLLCSKSDNLAVHHLSYENLGKEYDWELCILCSRCHEKIHFITGKKRTDRQTICMNVFKLKFGLAVRVKKPKKVKPKREKIKYILTKKQRKYYRINLGSGTYTSILSTINVKDFDDYLSKCKQKYRTIILHNKNVARELFEISHPN